jgi:hypothetical protein
VARETIVKLIDDIDGTTAAETVTFGIDGVAYEIDLSAKNAEKLRNVLAPYVEKGARVDRRRVATLGGRGAASRARGGSGERDQNKAIRAWAQRKGYEVAPRGRIRQELVDQYHKEAGR